jgi:TRAP-type C4-dicarboxylate transport system permease large subunit
LVKTAGLAGAILFIIGASTAMAWALTQSNFSHALVQAMIAVPSGHVGFLLISIAVFVVLGSILEGIPVMVLFGPLLFPTAKALGMPRSALRDRHNSRERHWVYSSHIMPLARRTG